MDEQKKQTLNPKQQWVVTGIGLVVLILSFVLTSTQTESVEADVTDLQSTVYELSHTLSERHRDEEVVRNTVIYETTGVHPTTIQNDKMVAETFFKPAFSWTNGEEYDQARATYSEALGPDSRFVTTYLAENMAIDEYNYIDVKELQADFQSMDVFALEERDQAMDYLGVITYYMVNSSSALEARSKLAGSQAIVRFTVDGEDDERRVTVVDAYPGFNNLISEE